MSQESVSELFETCVRQHGTAYLQAEGLLVAQGNDALGFLQTQQETNPDPFVRLLASVMARWIQGDGSLFQQALTYIDAYELEDEKMQLVSPRSDSIAKGLLHRYEKKVAAFLAVRLVKEPEWPHWKVAAVALYLSFVNDPELEPAIAQFEAENQKPQHAHLISLAREVHDPASIERANPAKSPDNQNKLKS